VPLLRLRDRVALVAVSLACLVLSDIAVAAGPGNGYDGLYRGAAVLDRGGESVCGRASYPMSVSVVNGQFNVVWDPSHHVGVNLQVQPDGSFSGSQMYAVGPHSTQTQLKASGKISGNALDAHIEGGYCSRNYHLTKG
jgi:hypothetical protein